MRELERVKKRTDSLIISSDNLFLLYRKSHLCYKYPEMFLNKETSATKYFIVVYVFNILNEGSLLFCKPVIHGVCFNRVLLFCIVLVFIRKQKPVVTGHLNRP